MCGIAGIYDMTGRPVDTEDLKRFTTLLKHRGPDDSGIWAQGNVGLAHTRLSIIDLSVKGHQPMTNEDGSIWITYNGEVYNYLPLRAELEAKGHRFQSDTDTEVIVHLYEERGLACLDSLRGMFAFAIWDANKNQLFIARDRIGKKPLFYTVQDNIVVFASELKAITGLSWIHRQFDSEALAYIFAYDHIPWPRSIFSNIKKLPPSSYLLFSAEKAIEPPRRYWSIDLQKKTALSESGAVEELLQLMDQSVAMRLQSDVPVGMFLSGGLDSSFIVGLANRLVKEPIRTFSIGYADERNTDPEYSFSRMVAGHFNTIHKEIIFDKNVIEAMPALMDYYDEPFCIPNALAHYQLCRDVRKDVTVALTGDGADEIFAGYDVYKKFKMLQTVHAAIPSWHSDNHRDCTKGPLWMNLLVTPDHMWRGCAKQHAFVQRSLPLFETPVRELYEKFNVGDILTDFYAENMPASFLDGVLYTDLLINYAWSTTIGTDISGMSNSLEVRSPFLDHHVVEFAFSLPAGMKLRGFSREKHILYAAGRSFLPRAVVERKKMSYGSGIPYQKFFFDEWAAFVKSMIFDRKIEELQIFSLPKIEKLIVEPNCSNESFRLLWRVFCACVWMHGHL